MLVSMLLLGPGVANGQSFYDPGIELAGAVIAETAPAIQILSAGSDDTHCAIGGAVLAAEAERAFRRDGLTARPWQSEFSFPDLTLAIGVIGLPVGSVCAGAINVTLNLAMRPSVTGPNVVAESFSLLTAPSDRYVTEARSVVEQDVSVIANAIRRAKDKARAR